MTKDEKIQTMKIVNSLWENDLVGAKKNLTNAMLSKVQTFLIGKKKDVAKTMFKGDINEKG